MKQESRELLNRGRHGELFEGDLDDRELNIVKQFVKDGRMKVVRIGSYSMQKYFKTVPRS